MRRLLTIYRDDLRKRTGGAAAIGCKKQQIGFCSVPGERLMSSSGLQYANDDDDDGT